ncbi:CREG family protein [Acidocella sp. KAb 2-4]|uniref:CREG family protein n=1 Tax=Acidocella sp. KAb 2-4 TaxID=2885158 RepID=UPI001D08CE15|nr:CREG family protein [Acidocella sp. KAb 2-4]MCB5945732.1 CREG family protein [Acidocella sp. KAb 2-4]
MAVNQEALAEAAALLRGARMGTLATVAAGVPHAALVTPALDEDAQPLLLLSALSVHTRQLKAHAACALLVSGAAASENPQTAPRLCLTGEARIVPKAPPRARYLAAHPYAAQYVDFQDFEFWKIFVHDVQYIGGFGRALRLNFTALQHEISQFGGLVKG